jgi:hypothetical protein
MNQKTKFRLLVGLTALVAAGEAWGGSTTSDKGYGVDPCYKQCVPLLGAVTPKSEAQRVFHNCMAGCQHRGFIICPLGSKIPTTLNRTCKGL